MCLIVTGRPCRRGPRGRGMGGALPRGFAGRRRASGPAGGVGSALQGRAGPMGPSVGRPVPDIRPIDLRQKPRLHGGTCQIGPADFSRNFAIWHDGWQLACGTENEPATALGRGGMMRSGREANPRPSSCDGRTVRPASDVWYGPLGSDAHRRRPSAGPASNEWPVFSPAMNHTKLTAPRANMVSPGTRSHRSVCMTSVCMNSELRAYQ